MMNYLQHKTVDANTYPWNNLGQYLLAKDGPGRHAHLTMVFDHLMIRVSYFLIPQAGDYWNINTWVGDNIYW